MRSARWIAVCVLAACGPTMGGDDDDETCTTAFLAGDLVITEIMANPDGEDTGNEWFEIFNASNQAQSLVGVRLIASREDNTDESAHIMTAGEIGAGDYFVVGGVLGDLAPDYIDYGYGSELGALRNAAGRVALGCGPLLVDEALYEEMADGVARGLTGAIAPDYTANDDLANWCDATTEFGADGALGSPGAANPSCGGGPQTTCDDGGAPREPVAPEPGDLVITEVMPDPMRAGDADGEWFEVIALGDFDLNGLEVGQTPGEVEDTLSDPTCLSVSSGQHIVFAREAMDTLNGGLPAVDHLFAFGLTNSGGSLFIGRGGQPLDQVTWASVRAGKALSLDPRRQTPEDNDDPTSWCDGTAPYGLGDLGSPGAANPECELPLPEGMCMDGDTIRAIVPATAGDLVISEYMSDPDAADDATGEWFELRADAAVDLNGLELGTVEAGVPTMKDTLIASACIEVAAGAHIVFARSTEPGLNGMLPVVDQPMTFTLANSNRGIYIGPAAAPLDQVTWTSSTAGVAQSRDPDEARFCPAVAPYGAGDLGTPGGANPQCP